VALTSPPLISVVGALLAGRWRARFFYWVMDLNPDEALAAGWLRVGSAAARALDGLSRFSLRRADGVIALDRFMRERIMGKGVAPLRLHVIPPWSHDDHARYDPVGRARFRRRHGLVDKFVVMYSGNHSPCHPLQTLLEAARRLRGEAGVVFLFVGGGSELPRVQAFADQHRLGNIRCLPYQPLAELSASLSAADVHAVVMGDPFVGIIHPCKIYNVLAVAAPVLYVGPTPSHVTELLDSLPERAVYGRVAHGQVDQVLAQVERIRAMGARREALRFENWAAPFSRRVLLPRLLDLIEGRAGTAGPGVAAPAAGGRATPEVALTASS
jgi:glycosyltransferase involved in cell wall biosynthesis